MFQQLFRAACSRLSFCPVEAARNCSLEHAPSSSFKTTHHKFKTISYTLAAAS